MSVREKEMPAVCKHGSGWDESGLVQVSTLFEKQIIGSQLGVQHKPVLSDESGSETKRNAFDCVTLHSVVVLFSVSFYLGFTSL